MTETLKYYLKTAVLFTTIATGAYKGLDCYTDKKLQEVRRDFPSYVNKYNNEVGSLNYLPEFKLESLDIGLGGCASEHETIINDNPLDILVNPNKKEITQHELAHLYINKMIEETHPSWIRYEGPYISYQANMYNQLRTINEGCAEYLRIKCFYDKPHVEYIGCYLFVKPVLDKLGIEQGIKLLVSNPPKGEELKKPLHYYNRLDITE